MPPPQRLDPVEALRQLTKRFGRAESVSVPVSKASGLFLADEIEAPELLGAEHRRSESIASQNGFAVPRGAKPGDVLRLLGVSAVAGMLDPDGRSAAESGAAGPANSPRPDEGPPCAGDAWRVETGGAVPSGFDAFVGVGGVTIIGPRRIRLEEQPRLEEADAGASKLVRFPVGAQLGARLCALLAARGVTAVKSRLPFPVAAAVVGDELCNESGRASAPGERIDVTSAWLVPALRSLGLPVVTLGILPDDPESLRDAILHVRGRAEVLLLAGGLGEGVTDRTLESVQRFEADIPLGGWHVDGLGGMLIGRTLGIYLIGMPGRPLATAAAFDLLVRPTLLHRLGADPSSWDWTRSSVEAVRGPRAACLEGGGWRIQPARPATAGSKEAIVPPAGSWSAPLLPNQSGWLVFPPEPPPQGTSPLLPCYFQPSAALGASG